MSCTCECNRGGFCGGCGHAGCGRRGRQTRKTSTVRSPLLNEPEPSSPGDPQPTG